MVFLVDLHFMMNYPELLLQGLIDFPQGVGLLTVVGLLSFLIIELEHEQLFPVFVPDNLNRDYPLQALECGSNTAHGQPTLGSACVAPGSLRADGKTHLMTLRYSAGSYRIARVCRLSMPGGCPAPRSLRLFRFGCTAY